MDNNVQMLEGTPMTVSGTITKTFMLLLIAAVSAAAVVYEAFMGYTDKVMMIMKIALFAGLGTGLATAFVPNSQNFLLLYTHLRKVHCLQHFHLLWKHNSPALQCKQ